MRIRNTNFVSGMWALALGGICLGAGLPQSGLAQQAGQQAQGLEEVVITAERRSEDIQRTAVSVSVRDGEDLQEEGKYSLRSILEDVPGIEGGASAAALGTAGSGTDSQATGLVIRGIPSNVGVGGNITSVPSAAAVYVDGVYEGVGGGYDIDRVEALRGPQGTLYGRSATSGLVATHTRNPKLGEFGGNVSFEAGKYDLKHVSGGVNFPIGDTVAVRVSANKYQINGYRVERGGSSDITDGRIKLLFRPSEAFSLLLGAAIQNNKTVANGSTSRLPSPDSDVTFAAQPTSLSPGENKYRQFWADLSWDTGFGQLTYLPAYRTWTSDIILFQRPNPTPGVAVGAFDQYSVTDKDNFWTHELRLSSKADSTLSWQVGAFYYDNALHNNNYFNRQPSGAFYRGQDISRDTTAWSGFAEGTYPLTDATRVTAGLRFDKTTVQVNEDFTNNPNCITTIPGGVDSTLYCVGTLPMVHGLLSGNAGRRVFNKSTYKLRLEHDFTPENMVYAMVSTGVSPGDITLAVDLRPTLVVNGATVTNPDFQQPVPKEITSETLTSYELGSKNRFLDNRLQVNGGVFYYDYGAYTVANANVNGSVVNGVFVAIPTPTQFEKLSAPLKTYGLELESLYQLTPRDRIGFNYSYVHTRFTDKTRPVAGTQATFGDFFGLDEVAGSVPQRASLSYNHRFDLPGGSKLSAGAATRWLSAFTSSGLSKSQVNTVQAAVWPWIRTKGEFVSDLNASWTSPGGKYSVNGWARNVFNNQSKQGATVLNVNATNVAAGTAFANIGGSTFDPRTYGVIFNMKW